MLGGLKGKPGSSCVLNRDTHGFKTGNLVCIFAPGFLTQYQLAQFSMDVSFVDYPGLKWFEDITSFTQYRLPRINYQL